MFKITGLSVVIPNYNGVHLFPDTLPGIFSVLQELQLPYEVIVVDDCSTDDSISFLTKHYPEIRIISNQKNSGFSVTANKGVRAALHPVVLLLNSDVKLEPGYFQYQLPYFDDPDCFGVMGRIIGWNDENIQDAAKYPSFHQAKIKMNKNYLLEEASEMQRGLYTMYISGANALLHKEKFLQLGGFNELFSPFYVEDYELSLRAWRLGWTCYYEHRAVCRHRTSTSIQSKSRKNFIKMVSNRNKWFVHAIHLSGGKKLLWSLQLVLEIVVQTLLLKTYYLQAFYLFLKSYRGVRRARQRLKELAGEKPLVPVEKVAERILSSVQGKKIKIF